MRLGGQKVELVQEEGFALLFRHLQQPRVLLPQSPRNILFVVFVHHAVFDEFVDEVMVLRVLVVDEIEGPNVRLGEHDG